MRKKIRDRLKLHMSLSEITVALSDDNPEAARVCAAMPQHSSDRYNFGRFALFVLDDRRIYGGRIWSLYKDVCNENLGDMIGVLCAVQAGILSSVRLDHAITINRDALDIPAVMALVRERFPRFPPAG